ALTFATAGFCQRKLPHQPRAPFLEPEYVAIVWRARRERQVASGPHRRCGARVEPAMDFGMAVGKRQSPGAVMVTRRDVHQLKAVEVPGIEAAHIHDKESVVDPILAL